MRRRAAPRRAAPRRAASSTLPLPLPRLVQVRLVRERFMLLKSCVMAGKDDVKVPYLYHLGGGAAAAAAAAPHH